MKVMFIFGGLPHYYNAILNRLNRIPNLEISLVIPQKKGKSLGAGVYETDKGIEFKVYRAEEYLPYYKKPFFKGLKKIILQEQPDALVLGWPYILGFFFFPNWLWFLKQHNIKIIHKDIPYKIPKFQHSLQYYKSGEGFVDEELNTTDIHTKGFSFNLKYGFLAYLRRFYFNWVDAHVDYTEDAFEIFGSYGVKKEKIFIIYNSPDTDEILQIKEKISTSSPVLQPNPYRILHIGRLVKWKKVHLLIEILPQLKKDFPLIELVVIGTGPEMENLQKQAQDLQIADSVQFMGGIYEMEQLGKFLNASALYVLAGVGGLSINDAMCFDKPIICSECDGTEKKLVRDEYNGKFFENDSSEDLYQKIHYLLSNPELLQKMGENSGKIIQNEVNIHIVVEGYVKAFNFVSQNQFHLAYQR